MGKPIYFFVCNNKITKNISSKVKILDTYKYYVIIVSLIKLIGGNYHGSKN